MRAPGIVILLYGLLALLGGIMGYTASESTASVIAGSAFGLGLLVSSMGVLRGKRIGLLIAPILTLLLTAFFGYRLVQSGEIIPSGLMTALGLIALVLYFALR
ncbi:MAG: TMEM14 family protein [Candidatus Binatia bacterium]